MFVSLPRWYGKFFQHVAACAARRREARKAEEEARRRLARYVRLQLEGLEERIVPDAYTFATQVGGNLIPSVGSYSNVALWFDTTTNKAAGQLPGAADTATIPTGAVCNLTDISPTISSLTVAGTFNEGMPLTVTGTTLVSAGGALNVGSSNSQADATLTTTTLTDNGTTTVGSSSSTGSSATINAVFAALGAAGPGGILYLGAPSSGTSGDMTVSNTMTVSGTSALNVGGAGGVGGLLDVGTLTSASSSPGTPNVVINSAGEIDVKAAAALSGDTTVGGLLNAENIDAFTGAAVTLAGPGSVGGIGQMEAGINASVTFAAGSAWTINPDSAIGDAFKEGNFYVNGPVAVDSNFNPAADITLNPGGTLGGTGDPNITAKLTMLGGTLGPANGTLIDTSGEFTTNGVGTKTLASNLTNLSAFTDLNGTGSLGINTGATYLNETGTTDVELPSIVKGNLLYGGTFDNDANGTLTIKTPASLSTVISSGFVNTGTLNTEGGTLTVSAPFLGPDTLDGTLALGDDLTLVGTFASPVGFVLNAGLGHLKIGDGTTSGSGGSGAASLDVPSGVTDDVLGYLEVASNGTLSGAGQVYTNGTVEVDYGGKASIGSFQMGSSGTLKLHYSSLVNSKLAVAGSAELSGNLAMEFDDGYVPMSGATLTVLTAGSISGNFDSTPPDMTVGYTPTSVTLTQN